MVRFYPLICLPLLMTACTVTHTVTREDLLTTPPSSIRLFMKDGRLIELDEFIHSDETLIGVGEQHERDGTFPFVGRVSMEEITRMESRDRHSVSPWAISITASVVMLTMYMLSMDNSTTITYPIR